MRWAMADPAPGSTSSLARRPIAAIARNPAYPPKTVQRWRAPQQTAALHPTSPERAARARSTATVRQSSESAYPSQRNLGLLTSQRSTGRVTLLLSGLGDQFPQAGLKIRTPIGERQATAGKLLGLSRITLSHTHLGQAIKYLRLARCNAL